MDFAKEKNNQKIANIQSRNSSPNKYIDSVIDIFRLDLCKHHTLITHNVKIYR